MKKIKYTYTIGLFLMLAIIGFLYFATNSKEITSKLTSDIQKSDCDRKFLKWCEPNPVGVDYDNFAAENRDCTGKGSYRTCEQVSKALS